MFPVSSTFDYNKRLLKEVRDIWRHITNFFEVDVEKAAMFSHKMFPGRDREYWKGYSIWHFSNHMCLSDL